VERSTRGNASRDASSAGGTGNARNARLASDTCSTCSASITSSACNADNAEWIAAMTWLATRKRIFKVSAAETKNHGTLASWIENLVFAEVAPRRGGVML